MYVLGGCLVLARLLLAHRKQAHSARDFRWPLSVQLLVLTATLLGVLIVVVKSVAPAMTDAKPRANQEICGSFNRSRSHPSTARNLSTA